MIIEEIGNYNGDEDNDAASDQDSVNRCADGNFTDMEAQAGECSDGMDTSASESVACPCHLKNTPRSEKELRSLKNRLSRMTGQLNGIGRMLDENRYCGDILIQIAAVESALQSLGYLIYKEHMETCVVEEIRKGNMQVVEEAVELMKKLK